MKKESIALVASLLMLGAFALQSHAEPQVEYADRSEPVNLIYAGHTRDETAVAYLKKTGESHEIIKFSVDSFELNTIVPEGENVIDAVMSPDGLDVVWINRLSFPDEGMQLFKYNIETEITTQMAVPVLPGVSFNETQIRELKFIKDTGRLSYLLGSNASIPLTKHVVVQDIQSEAFELIEIDELTDDADFLSITTHDFSDDGTQLLYTVSIIYVATDCCYSRPGYVVLKNTSDNTPEVVIDISDAGRSYVNDLSGDGQTFVYQRNNKIVKYDVAQSTPETLDIEVLGGINYRLNWLELSYDGTVLAASGLGNHGDGGLYSPYRRFDYNGNTRVDYSLRPDAMVVMDLTTRQTEVLNKFNGVQMYPAQPLFLKSDGSSVFYVSAQYTYFERVSEQFFINHPIEFHGFKADESLSGAWYDAENPGQGIFISVAPNPNQVPVIPIIAEGNAMPILSWYTVDNQGQPYWLLVQGEFINNTITGDAYIVTGSQFGASYQSSATETTRWGQVTMTFDDCFSASVVYEPELEGFDSGAMNMTRLSTQAGLGCL